MDLGNNIIAKIKNQIYGARVEASDLTGTNNHYGLTVISDEFAGISILDQHRMVMNVLSADLQSDLHAIKIKTMTPEKYLQSQTN